MIAVAVAAIVALLTLIGKLLFDSGKRAERAATDTQRQATQLKIEAAKRQNDMDNRALDELERARIRKINHDLTTDLEYTPKTPAEAVSHAEASIERAKKADQE